MRKLTFFIDQAAKGLAPPDWWQNNRYNIQRLFYIKGGKGYIVDENGRHTQFIPGKIYVFPSNIYHNFMTGNEDCIDHIYFDFYSTPPIVSMSPLIYDVPPDSALESIVETLDRLLPDRLPGGARHDQIWSHTSIPRDFTRIANAPHKSNEEFKQIIYSLFDTLINLLSYERELPLSDDREINEVLEKIRKCYNEDLSVAKLAADSGFEVNYFIRRFRKIVGVTPYSYLKSYRLAKAQEFYSLGYTMAQVAEMVGYEDASSLSRAMKTK